MFGATKLVMIAYIGAVELSVSVTFPSVVVMIGDIGFVIEPISLFGEIGGLGQLLLM